jgi:phytoene dehydrogenase-like protein
MSNKKEVLVVGAGLAGLTSALTLQKEGYSVVLLERRPQVGGLCGTFFMDGYEFVIACNDFGSGLMKLLSTLGVDQAFTHKKSSVFYNGKWFNASPNLKMMWQLRSEWRNILSVVRGIFIQQKPRTTPKTIEEFANRYSAPGAVNDFVKLIAYFMGVAPTDILTTYFGLDGRYGYGYTKMACPVGGPQAMVDAIAHKFLAQGGKLLLNTSYHHCTQQNNRYLVEVETQQERLHLGTDYIVDTSEPKHPDLKNRKRGLPLSMMCVAVNNTFIYPPDTHTLSYYEPNVSDWFSKLDNGVKPKNFGFHVFKSDLKPQANSCYGINVYFYLPRDINQLNDTERVQYTDYLLEKIEQMLPGITQHITYSNIVTPDDFEALHGLSSRVMPYIDMLSKPKNRDTDAPYFYAGHNVYPPGEHAGAAALSGHLVAKKIIAV